MSDAWVTLSGSTERDEPLTAKRLAVLPNRQTRQRYPFMMSVAWAYAAEGSNRLPNKPWRGFDMRMARAIGFTLLLLTVPCFAGDLEAAIKLHEHKQYTKAAIVFQRAAEHGSAEALRQLGFMYYHGQGVTQDNKQAVFLFEKSANAGDMQSASNLAKMYEFGMGVGQDDARAAEWYRRAAEMGDPVSQFGASIMYYTGQGVPRDRVEAVKWWTLAMTHGAEWAKWTEAIRPTIESAQGKLTAEEITQGRDRAEMWSKAHVKSN